MRNIARNKGNYSDWGILFYLHLAIILLWYASPIIFSWYYVLIGAIFSYAQGILIGGCLLTHLEIGKRREYTFFGYYLEKIGIKTNKRVMKWIFFWLEPAIVLAVALLWQTVLGNKAILF